MGTRRHPSSRFASQSRSDRRRLRLTLGNFRLLVRLLTQMDRVLARNGLQPFSLEFVERAREDLVIGQA